LYETADGGWIALGALEMKFAVSILTMLGRPDLIDLCRLPPGRGHDPVREFLKSMFLTRPRDAWIAFFTGHDVPIAPVKTLPEVLDDAHFRARGMVTTNANGWDQIGSPICFTDEPGMPSERLPHHGEHTREILQNIGYGSAEIARLEAGGAVRCEVAKG
jgi:crotonobetainyl-CoA:carnitine CoA-transferase CaiB-like acyl-CoA transferase